MFIVFHKSDINRIFKWNGFLYRFQYEWLYHLYHRIGLMQVWQHRFFFYVSFSGYPLFTLIKNFSRKLTQVLQSGMTLINGFHIRSTDHFRAVFFCFSCNGYPANHWMFNVFHKGNITRIFKWNGFPCHFYYEWLYHLPHRIVSMQVCLFTWSLEVSKVTNSLSQYEQFSSQCFQSEFTNWGTQQCSTNNNCWLCLECC